MIQKSYGKCECQNSYNLSCKRISTQHIHDFQNISNKLLCQSSWFLILPFKLWRPSVYSILWDSTLQILPKFRTDLTYLWINQIYLWSLQSVPVRMIMLSLRVRLTFVWLVFLPTCVSSYVIGGKTIKFYSFSLQYKHNSDISFGRPLVVYLKL